MIGKLNLWFSPLLLIASQTVANPVAAADLGGGGPAVYMEAPRPLDQWVVQVTPYAWLPFLTGSVEIKGRTTEIDVSPIDILSHLETVPWMSYIEARRGPLSFYSDVFYANAGISGSAVKPRDFGPFGSAALGASASLDFESKPALPTKSCASHHPWPWTRSRASAIGIRIWRSV
jgi:hypothetical protein